MSYIEEAKELVQNRDQRMAPSPYDIAWLARLQGSGSDDARWPDLIEWLLEHQHPDGSWGGEIVYYHDRIISTLAAAIALHQNGRTRRTQKSCERGERYLWHHLHMLPRDPFELSGFELILPTLLGEARSLGLNVPSHACGYGEIQSAKLRLIPPQMLYSPDISTVYSLEFLGQAGDVNQLQEAINPSGSVGNSPATTAYYLSLCDDDGDKRASEYLETMRERNRLITVYPFSIFETGWILNNLILSGVPITEFAEKSVFDELYAQMTPTGFALDSTFGISDGDITSVCCRVLLDAGYDVDPLVLANFEKPDTHTFRTYNYERNISISTNVHALDALRILEDYPNQEDVISNIAMTLLENREYNIYWNDKWHASPYYTTSHALVGLLQDKQHMVYAYACQNTVDWIVCNQRDDGSWGFYRDSTAEETAYALTALLYYYRQKPSGLNADILHRGASYLSLKHRTSDWTYPELWLAKSLYAPHDIVRAAILAALILYTDTFGGSP